MFLTCRAPRFAATLAGSYSYTTVPTELRDRAGAYPYSVSVDISYDLIQGGHDSTAWLDARSASSEALAQRNATLQQLLDARIAFGGLMAGLYSGSCGVTLLSSVRERIDATLAAAAIQLKTGIMGQRDYLNFAALENSFASQQVQLEASPVSQQQQVRALGPHASQMANQKPKPEACEIDISATREFAQKHMLSPRDLEMWVAEIPAGRSAKASLRAAQYNRDVVEKRLRPSLSPFINSQVTRSDFVTQTLVQVVGGLSLDWAVPGERGVHEMEEAAWGLAAATSLQTSARMQMKATLSELNTGLKSQIRVLDVLEKSLLSSSQLINTREALQLIGAVDSLNFTTAYLNNMSLRQAILSASATVHRNVFSLRAYKRALKMPAALKKAPNNLHSPRPKRQERISRQSGN